jgi:hypothetical protein
VERLERLRLVRLLDTGPDPDHNRCRAVSPLVRVSSAYPVVIRSAVPISLGLAFKWCGVVRPA